MKLLFLSLLILTGSVVAQEKMNITNFKGLQTSKGDFQILPNELRVCHNVNLSRNGIGTLSPQLGSVEIFVFPGADSVVGLETMSYRDGTEQMIAAVDSEGVGYANIYASVLNSDQFGAKIDSTEIIYNTPAYDNYISENDDDTIVVQHIFNIKRPGRDIQVTLYDTIYNSSDWLESNDIMVARANAEVTLSAYITADTTGDIEDTAYFYKPDKADTAVTFSWSASGLRLGGIIGDTLFRVQIFNTTALTPNERIATHWGIQSPTDFAQFNDKLYVVNGQQKGVVFNGDYTSPWPMNAPGEISVIPIADSTADNISGEFRYLIKYSSDSTSFVGTLNGILTPPVKIQEGKILLKNFPVPAHSDTTAAQMNDTFAIQIYRTFANPGRITRSDSAYLHSTHTFLTITDSSAFDLTVIDSIADDNLGAAVALKIADADIDYSARTTKKYGAPLVADDSSGVPNGKNIFLGTSALTTGVAYIVTFVDSANGTESDSSRALLIERDGGGNEDQYIIGLPIANVDFQVYKNIYRTNVFTTTWDTLSIYLNTLDTVIVVNSSGGVDTFITANPSIPGGIDFPPSYTAVIPGENNVIDRGNYRLVAQVPNSQAFFHDSIPYDSLVLQPEKFESRPAPSGLEQVFVFDGRLFGIRGSRVYNSRIGLLNEWELFDFAGFDLDDGDQITMGLPFRGGLLIGKHFKAFNWYDINAKTLEFAGVPGCVAPRSAIQANGANYYVSNRGVIALSEGAALIRHHESELLSKPLRNFLELDFADLRTAVGAYVPQTEQLWWSIGDTTYIYDFEADAWTTSSLTFGGSTLWDTDVTQDFLPGRSLYYYQANDSVIYRFGEGHRTTNGSWVDMTVESGPLFPDADRQQITGVALWAQPEATYTLAAINFYDEGDTLIAADYSLMRVDRRRSFSEFSLNPAVYYRYILKSLSSAYPMSDGGIDRLDIHYTTLKEIDWE